jgi:hypothetical protein
MSRRTSSTKTKTKTPFCKVCFDSGKPSHLYNSHYVRQTPHTSSMIVCPTLLAHVCAHCNMTGHFVSTCPKAKREAKEQRAERMATNRHRNNVAAVAAPITNKNPFATLAEHSDSDCEEPPKKMRKRIIDWACADSDSDSD